MQSVKKSVCLIKPKKGAFLQKAEHFKKRGHQFTLISIWKKATFVVDSIPKTKVRDDLFVKDFKTVAFKDGEESGKASLQFPESACPTLMKDVKRALKNDELWLYPLEGWKRSITWHLVGGFDHEEVQPRQLSMTVQEVRTLNRHISADQFLEFSDNGMPRSVYDELSGDSKPVFDESFSLFVDDDQVVSLHDLLVDRYEMARQSAEETGFPPSARGEDAGVYAVTGHSWIKRSRHELTIYEPFDPQKLSMAVTREWLVGSSDATESFMLAYDGREFEFLENAGEYYSELYLIGDDGSRSELSVFEDDDE